MNEWKEAATVALKAYIRIQTEDSFTAEQVREFAAVAGIEMPTPKQSWGNFMKSAKSAGIIKPCGDVFNAHGNPVRLWQAA